MNALNRKLIRELLGMKGQVIAICLVIASGIATLVMTLSTLQSLELNRTTYYQRYRFADVFAVLKRAPDSLHERIARIDNVAAVQTRVVVDVTIDVEGLAEPAVGRLISVPEQGRPRLNGIYLRRGRYIEPGRTGEVMIGESFAGEHNLGLGDSVGAIINGHRQKLTIVGIALSPEYVLQVREGSLLPDQRLFGVFWMGREELAAAFDLEGSFNNISLQLMRGASEDEVVRQLDALTAPYGGVGAYGRDRQQSNRYLSDEIRQLRHMGSIVPTMFLSVAAFLLNVVLARMISTQREVIAALKAFGYSQLEVGWHYMKFALLIIVVGVILGIALGGWMGNGVTQMYTRFYKFPVFTYHLDGDVIAIAVVVSLLAGVAGAVGSVRKAMRLPPAEAMRPEPPSNYRATIVERIGFQRFFSQEMRMIVRHLERRPLKSFISCVGIAMSVAILILGSFTLDAINYLIDFQFYLSQRDDVTIAFVEPTSAQSLHDVAHLPGVVYCEPFRSVATRLRFGHRSYRVGIMGLPENSQLYKLFDKKQNPVSPPHDGLLLSEKLAEILGVELGDLVTIEVLEGQRVTRQLPVAALIADFAGANAYMEIDSVRSLLRESKTLSGAFLQVDPRDVDQLYHTLKETPQVAHVTVKQASVQSFRDTVGENLLRMRIFNIGFACVIAIGVVYNTARISLSERSRELATLRVIGFTRAEISMILLGELALLTLVAMPLGIGFGYLLAWVVTLGLDTESYRIPLVIESATYAQAVTVVVFAALFSGLIVRRKLDRLDLVAVLKTKE